MAHQSVHELCAVVNVELVVDPPTVRDCGVLADAESLGDSFIRGSARHEEADLNLSVAERQGLDASHQFYLRGFMVADGDANQAWSIVFALQPVRAECEPAPDVSNKEGRRRGERIAVGDLYEIST